MAKIFVVDDRPDHATTMKAVLESAGHSVTALTDSTKVLEVAEKERPDVIMSDINMPEVDGYELAKLLKMNNETSDIVILLFSATEKAGEIFKKSLNAGAEDFIRMPADNDEIISRMEVCLARKKAEDELRKRLRELEIYYRATMDREKRIIELKKRVKELEGK